ncbi:MHYT domain-containing protein [Yinghuangia sp. YIM S09857]|uniref:MHYT domain-containing protein n=1 Tax=Yinghuangia sp. YIM S09857 TaxID=3436929 RepID=UPI003F52B438
MGHIHHFSSGPLTPLLAYGMSCLGAALGLLCTSRARALTGGPSRWAWFALAAISIGGTGIWVMHFVGMLGFSVEGTPVRYDVPRTVASLGVAVAVVAAGLVTAATGRARLARLVTGGVLTGAGVAGMHYLGMSAMNLRGSLEYDKVYVAASVAIAVVAATAALWFALNVRGPLATAGAALVMGVAVCGMHYTGMAALSADLGAPDQDVAGAATSSFIAPLITGISLFTVVTLFIVALSPTEDEIREDADFDARLARLSQPRGPRDGAAH